jgi:hypothetical protein
MQPRTFDQERKTGFWKLQVKIDNLTAITGLHDDTRAHIPSQRGAAGAGAITVRMAGGSAAGTACAPMLAEHKLTNSS